MWTSHNRKSMTFGAMRTGVASGALCHCQGHGYHVADATRGEKEVDDALRRDVVL